jgi:copper chaperone CopZ
VAGVVRTDPHSESEEAGGVSTQTFSVSGLTCGTCLALLLEKLRSLDGVTAVGADLAQEAASRVVVSAVGAIDPQAVREAALAAGFGLTVGFDQTMPAIHSHATGAAGSALDPAWFPATSGDPGMRAESNGSSRHSPSDFVGPSSDLDQTGVAAVERCSP